MFSEIKKNLAGLWFQPRINPSPVLILGNQKTGTSVMAHLLADYGELSKTIDIPENFWPVIRDLLSGEINLIDIARKYPARFATDIIKDPNLTFLYKDLLTLHPDASFVFVIRDPRANIRSLLNRMSTPGSLKELDVGKCNIEEVWVHIFDTDIWNLGNYSHYIDILATRWNRAADVYLEHAEDMILVRYEDFMADKVGVIEQTAAKLGIEKRNDISGKVDIQYQPRGDRDISWLEFFGEENLRRITDICGERMKHFGYKINGKISNVR